MAVIPNKLAPKKALENVEVQVRTLHFVAVVYDWSRHTLRDSTYQAKVNRSMDEKVVRVLRKYAVEVDKYYYTPYRGIQFKGENRDQVEAAGKELARHLTRFFPNVVAK